MKAGGIPIGSLFGIRILVHPAWLLVFVLLTVAVAAFGGSLAGQQISAPSRVVLGVVVSVLFFLSVLVHELGHALVARRSGIPVREMSVLIFGGTVTPDRDVPNARTEALVAAAGPSASLAVAGVFLLVWVLAPVDLTARDAAASLVGATAAWLAITNAALAAFHLVPAFPMDGARLVRAVVWGITGDTRRATRVASRVGRAFAYVVIAAGVVVAVTASSPAGVMNGIWLAVIGWFLRNAADAGYRRAEFERLIGGVVVGDVMERDVAVVSPNLTLDTLVEQHLMSGQASLYPVTHDGVLVGTIEIAQVTGVPRGDWPATRVTDVMKRGEAMTTVTEPTTLLDAVARFEETAAAALPVVAEDDPRSLRGLLTREGVFRALRHRAALGS